MNFMFCNCESLIFLRINLRWVNIWIQLVHLFFLTLIQ
jgi:hypothetical protein